MEEETVEEAVICVPPEEDVHHPANEYPVREAVGSDGEAYVPPMVYVASDTEHAPPLALKVTDCVAGADGVHVT